MDSVPPCKNSEANPRSLVNFLGYRGPIFDQNFNEKKMFLNALDTDSKYVQNFRLIDWLIQID